MDNTELYPAIGEAVYAYIREHGQVGTLKDITPIAENVWMVRFHVVHPTDSIEIFAVVERDEGLTVSLYDPEQGRGVTWDYADHDKAMRIYYEIAERYDRLLRELAQDD